MRQAKMILIFGFIFLIGIAGLFGQINISSEELSLKPALAERQNTIIDFSLRVPEQIDSKSSEAALIAEKPGNGTRVTKTSTGRIWSNASHWTPQGVPIATDDVVINSLMQIGTVPRVCNSLIVNSIVNSGSRLTVNSKYSLTVGPGDITINGGLFLPTGAPQSELATSLFAQGNLTINSGGKLTADTANTKVCFNGTTAQTFTNNGSVSAPYLYKMILDNPAGLTLGSDIPVNILNFDQTEGEVSGTKPNINGYSSPSDFKRLRIAVDNNVISGFSVDTNSANNLPDMINREWTINGSHTDTKSVTFSWDAADDDNFDWDGLPPAVYDKTTSTYYTATAYNTSSDPRSITVSLPSFAGNTYTIRRFDESTLPVELSSFTLSFHVRNQVKIQWVTQSETNVSGFRIYRNTENLLETAQMLDLFVPATNTSQMKVYLATDNEIYEDGIYYYWLESADLNGESTFHGPVYINVTLLNDFNPEVPIVQGVNKAYPNPFNPVVNISCGMMRGGQTTVQVFNARGQLVKTLFSGNKEQGNFLLQWDGTDQYDQKLPSGVYLIRMDSDYGNSLHKVLLSK